MAGGFLPRFLCCQTHAKAQHIALERKATPGATVARYDAVLRELLARYRLHEGKPFLVGAGFAARKIIIDYTNRTTDRRNSGELGATAGLFAARYGEFAWKLALVFHAVEHGSHAHCVEVSAETARKAVAVVSWFSVQQLGLIGEADDASEVSKTDKIMTLVNKFRRVTARMVRERGVCIDSKEARVLLDDLVKQGILQSADHVGRGSPTKFYSLPPNLPPRR